MIARITPETAPLLSKLPFVNYLEPLSNGATGAQQVGWGVLKVRADSVWRSLSDVGEWAAITILDSGIDSLHYTNPTLDGPENLFADCLYIPSAGSTCFQGHAHGSAVAGVIAARDNSYGIIGIAYAPRNFASVRVCDDAGNCTDAALAAGLDWATSTGCVRHIVNMSLQYCSPGSVLAEAITRASQAGILLVSIAGNTDYYCAPSTQPGTGGVTFPGRYPEVIAVSGTLSNDAFATAGNSECTVGSRQGPQVSLSAPFWAVTMSANGQEGNWCGTSFSAPVVSAVAAMVWSRFTTMTASQVRAKLQSSSLDLGAYGRDDLFGYGRVDAVAATNVPALTNSINVNGTTYTSVPSGGIPPYSYLWESCSLDCGDAAPPVNPMRTGVHGWQYVASTQSISWATHGWNLRSTVTDSQNWQAVQQVFVP